MNILPQDPNGCPYLMLAPMEGVGDRCFRKAMATVGGFDEAIADFLRVPKNAHVESLALAYQSNELSPIPLAAQLMGSEPETIAAMGKEIEKRGAHHINLNCGCPSNTVTGRGAGSSLLKEPSSLYEVAKALVSSVSVPVTIKMRSGFDDISLFKENLLAAEESGARYIILHPRTKVDGYGPPARWDLIAEAKSLLHIPVVGNGDILNVQDALNMLKTTRCDALMIGRGSVINPFIFHEIRAHFAGTSYTPSWENLATYLDAYTAGLIPEVADRIKVNKLKQLMGFLFKANPPLLELRQSILTSQHPDTTTFLAFTLPLLKKGLAFSTPNHI